MSNLDDEILGYYDAYCDWRSMHKPYEFIPGTGNVKTDEVVCAELKEKYPNTFLWTEHGTCETPHVTNGAAVFYKGCGCYNVIGWWVSKLPWSRDPDADPYGKNTFQSWNTYYFGDCDCVIDGKLVKAETCTRAECTDGSLNIVFRDWYDEDIANGSIEEEDEQMVKMLKLGKASGPCNLCGATGLVQVWDSEGEFEPCEACKGTGHNSGNFIVLERETKKTKFQKKCEILEEAWYSFQYDEQELQPLWVTTYCDPTDYYDDITPGIYLARMYLNDQAERKRAEGFINMAFDNLLSYYSWKHDMGFKNLAQIVAGGQYWSEADEQ